ncbi:hypothetical protein Agub_g8188 [Astrephomene gubernaculifera]|uniref:Uncharacterized protein n=1 Tax=Astrephomene gubernaculifera TaxID=47775 RepID=A0AAD3DTY9_9CHLO|nr:hypothetical protein Agub_g8188 [Astrephomene gubernaculifera]
MKSNRGNLDLSSLASSALGARGHMSLDEGLGLVTAAVAAASKQQLLNLDKKNNKPKTWNTSTRASPAWKTKTRQQENKENRTALPKKFQHVQSKLSAPIFQRRSAHLQLGEVGANSGALSAGATLQSSLSVGAVASSLPELPQSAGGDMDAVTSSEIAAASLCPFVTTRRGNMSASPLHDSGNAFPESWDHSVNTPAEFGAVATASPSGDVDDQEVLQHGVACAPVGSPPTHISAGLPYDVSEGPTPSASCTSKPAPSNTPPECTSMVLALEGAAQRAAPDAASGETTSFRAWLASMGIDNSPLPEAALRVLWQKTVQQEALIEQLKESELQLAQQEADERARHVGLLLAENEDLQRAKTRLQRELQEARERLAQLKVASMPLADSPAMIVGARRLSGDWALDLSPRDNANMASSGLAASASGVRETSQLIESTVPMGGIASPGLMQPQEPSSLLTCEQPLTSASVTSVCQDGGLHGVFTPASDVNRLDATSPNYAAISANQHPGAANWEPQTSVSQSQPWPSSSFMDLAACGESPAMAFGVSDDIFGLTPASASGSIGVAPCAAPASSDPIAGLGPFGPASPCDSIARSLGAMWSPPPSLGAMDASSPQPSVDASAVSGSSLPFAFKAWGTAQADGGACPTGETGTPGEIGSVGYSPRLSPGLSVVSQPQHPVSFGTWDSIQQEGSSGKDHVSPAPFVGSMQPASAATPSSHDVLGSTEPPSNLSTPLQAVPVSPRACAGQLRCNPLFESDSPASCMSGALPERLILPGPAETPIQNRLADFCSLASTPMTIRSDYPGIAPTPDVGEGVFTPAGAVHDVVEEARPPLCDSPASGADMRASAVDLSERLVAFDTREPSTVASPGPADVSMPAVATSPEANSGSIQRFPEPSGDGQGESSSAVATDGMEADGTEVDKLGDLILGFAVADTHETSPGAATPIALAIQDALGSANVMELADGAQPVDLGALGSPVGAAGDAAIATATPFSFDASDFAADGSPQTSLVAGFSPRGELTSSVAAVQPTGDVQVPNLDVQGESHSPAAELDDLVTPESTEPETCVGDQLGDLRAAAIDGVGAAGQDVAEETGRVAVCSGDLAAPAPEYAVLETQTAVAQQAADPGVGDSTVAHAFVFVDSHPGPSVEEVDYLATPKSARSAQADPDQDAGPDQATEGEVSSSTTSKLLPAGEHQPVLPPSPVTADSEEHASEPRDEGFITAPASDHGSAESSPSVSAMAAQARDAVPAGNSAAKTGPDSGSRSSGSHGNSYPSTPTVNRQASPTSTIFATPLEAFATPTSLASIYSAARLTALQMYGSVPNSIARELTPGAPTPSEFSFGFGRQQFVAAGMRSEAPTPAFGFGFAAGNVADAEAATPRLGPHQRVAGLAAFGSPLPVMQLTPVQLRVLDRLAGEVIAAMSPVVHASDSASGSPAVQGGQPEANNSAQPSTATTASGFNMAQFLAQLHSPLPAAMQPQGRRVAPPNPSTAAPVTVDVQQPHAQKGLVAAGGQPTSNVTAPVAHAPSPARNFSSLLAFLNAAGRHAPTPGVAAHASRAVDSGEDSQTEAEAVGDDTMPAPEEDAAAAAHRDAVAAAAVISFAQLLAHLRSPMPQGGAARNQPTALHTVGAAALADLHSGVDSPVAAAGAHDSPANSEAASFGFSTAAKQMAARMTPSSTPGEGGLSFLRWAHEAPPSFRIDSDLRSTARHARSASNPPSPLSFSFGLQANLSGDFTPTVGGGHPNHMSPFSFGRSGSHQNLFHLATSPARIEERMEAVHQGIEDGAGIGSQATPSGTSPAPSLGFWNFGVGPSCTAPGASPTASQLGFTFGNTCPSAMGTPCWFPVGGNAGAAAFGTPTGAKRAEGAGVGGSAWDELVAMSPTLFGMAAEGSPEDTPGVVQRPRMAGAGNVAGGCPEISHAEAAAAAMAGVPEPASFWANLLGNLLSPMPAITRSRRMEQSPPSQQQSASQVKAAPSFEALPEACILGAPSAETRVPREDTFSFNAEPASSVIRVASNPPDTARSSAVVDMSEIPATKTDTAAQSSLTGNGAAANAGAAGTAVSLPDTIPPPPYEDLPELIARGLCMSVQASAEKAAPVLADGSAVKTCSSMGENVTPLACHQQAAAKLAPVVAAPVALSAVHPGSPDSPAGDRLFTPTRHALVSVSSAAGGCSRAVPASQPSDTLVVESVTGSNMVGMAASQADIQVGCTTDPIVTPSRLLRTAVSSNSMMAHAVTSSSMHTSPVLSFGAAVESAHGCCSSQVADLTGVTAAGGAQQLSATTVSPARSEAATQGAGQGAGQESSLLVDNSIGFSADAVERLLFLTSDARGDVECMSAVTADVTSALPEATSTQGAAVVGSDGMDRPDVASATATDAEPLIDALPKASEASAGSDDTVVTAGSEVASAVQATPCLDATEALVTTDADAESTPSRPVAAESGGAEAAAAKAGPSTPESSPAPSAHPSIFDGVQPASSNTPFSYISGTIPPTPRTADLASTSKSVALPASEHVAAAGHFWAPSPSGLKGAITERVTLEVLNRRISASADLLLDFQGSPGHPYVPPASVTGATTPRLKGNSTGACTPRSLASAMVSPGRKGWAPPRCDPSTPTGAAASQPAAVAQPNEVSLLPKAAATSGAAGAAVHQAAAPAAAGAAGVPVKAVDAADASASARARLLLSEQAPPVQQLIAASVNNTLASAAAAVLHPAGVPADHVPLSQRLGLWPAYPAAWGVPCEWSQSVMVAGVPVLAQPAKPTGVATQTGPTPVQQAGPSKPAVVTRDVQTTPGLQKLFDNAAKQEPEASVGRRSGVPSLPRPPASQTLSGDSQQQGPARKTSFRSRIPAASSSASEASSLAAPSSAAMPVASGGAASTGAPDDDDDSSPVPSEPMGRVGRRGRLLSHGGPQRIPVKLGEDEVRRRANVLGMRISPYLRTKQVRGRGPQAPKPE